MELDSFMAWSIFEEKNQVQDKCPRMVKCGSFDFDFGKRETIAS